MRGKLKDKLPFWMTLLILIICWHIVTSKDFVDTLFLPKLSELGRSFYLLFSEKGFLSDITISIWRVWFSFLLSFVLAVPLALVMSESKNTKNIVSPYIDYIRYLPVPVLIPLTILFFGIDEASKIVLLFIGTFFPFILLVLDDLKEIPKEYLDVSFTLNFNRFEQLRMKLLAILPQLYDNSRISIGICWTYLVIAELVAAEKGIGHMIKEAQRFSNTPDIYTGILTMGIIGFLTDYALKIAYPWFFSYKVENN